MPVSEAEAKAAWLAKLDVGNWGTSAKAYPNLPASVQPGVVTGQALMDLLNDAKTRGCGRQWSPNGHHVHSALR